MTPDSRLPTPDFFMHRCLELAKNGSGYVAPNPMVGALLVNEGKIIGEGFHQQYGGPHAEVNCINSVREADKDKISTSILYVSLEPCSHFGKTPPCTDMIIANKIPEVVIGCRDPFKGVDGKGIEKLKTAGVKVEYGILENECQQLNKRFFTFHKKHRPYIILKWAETADGKMAPFDSPEGGEPHAQPSLNEGSDLKKEISTSGDSALMVPTNHRDRKGARLYISNDQTNRLVHKWRSEEASILVGTNTALLDDPELTTRNWVGPSPVRLVVDRELKLPPTLKLFNKKQRTVIFNTLKHEERDSLLYYQVTEDVNLIHQIINALYQMKIQSVLVEGGARLLQSFIDEGMWDEIRRIKNEELKINNGLAAPELLFNTAKSEMKILNDSIKIYQNELG
jgi:diaminohydroxyphosphoribosylaminopyrimidine deaminase/5-amino-6-(5-phosphoribosylamino)uracil reductase